jgi:hypothetical protein
MDYAQLLVEPRWAYREEWDEMSSESARIESEVVVVAAISPVLCPATILRPPNLVDFDDYIAPLVPKARVPARVRAGKLPEPEWDD